MYCAMAVNSALRAAFNCSMTFSLPRICTLLPLPKGRLILRETLRDASQRRVTRVSVLLRHQVFHLALDLRYLDWRDAALLQRVIEPRQLRALQLGPLRNARFGGLIGLFVHLDGLRWRRPVATLHHAKRRSQATVCRIESHHRRAASLLDLRDRRLQL